MFFFLFFLAGTTFSDGIESNEVSGGTDYYIEVMVLADQSMVDFHGKGHIEKYLNTMMRIVSIFLYFRSITRDFIGDLVYCKILITLTLTEL